MASSCSNWGIKRGPLSRLLFYGTRVKVYTWNLSLFPLSYLLLWLLRHNNRECCAVDLFMNPSIVNVIKRVLCVSFNRTLQIDSCVSFFLYLALWYHSKDISMWYYFFLNLMLYKSNKKIIKNSLSQEW